MWRAFIAIFNLRRVTGKETRIILGAEAYRALVRGGEVTVKDANVKLILQDIGFAIMETAIYDARDKRDLYKPVTVTADGGRA
jgi:hypothetical protein